MCPKKYPSPEAYRAWYKKKFCRKRPSCHQDPPCVYEPPADYADRKDTLIVDSDIVENTVWSGVVNVAAEVHVRRPHTLRIMPHTTILFHQCLLCNAGPTSLPYACLVVDSGASINAEETEFRSSLGGQNSTGGLIILGNKGPGVFQFENYTTVRSEPGVASGRSSLICCSFNNLGNNDADLNALTLARLDDCQLQLSQITVDDAGDDAIELFGSVLSIDRLSISDPFDDGLDVDEESTMSITESFQVRGRWYFNYGDGQCPPAITGGPLGTGLMEATNGSSIVLGDGASFYLGGRLSDKPGSFAGNWASLQALSVNFVTGVGPASFTAA